MSTKSIIANLFAVAVLIHLSGCAATRPDLSDAIDNGREVRLYEVFGMDCPGCHGGLEKLVKKIPGVNSAKANWEKQQLQVVLYANADVDESAIHNAIKQANFTPGKRLR